MARGGPLGALHGLPVAHKDLVDTAGIRTTRGSPFYRDHVPTRDALIVTRMRAAGAITLGKTNTPEFGAGSQTFNAVFGATRNPYDVSKTCGGSSGGAAVALACGMVPIADGSDTGGSLRNPAAFCNVVGFRPSPGRVPAESRSWSPLSVSGPMARSVADVALFLSAIAGPDPRSPLSIAEDGARFRAPLARSFKGARIAWWKGLGGIPDRGRDTSSRRWQSEGVRRYRLPRRGRPNRTSPGSRTRSRRCASREPRAVCAAGSPASRLGEGHDQIRSRRSAEQFTGADIGRAMARQAQMFDQSREFFERYDYFVLPVTQVAPFDVDDAVPDADRRHANGDLHRLDALVLVHHVHVQSGDFGARRVSRPPGCPSACRSSGRHRDDWSVLQLAYAFEQATRHGQRRPAL